MSNNSLSTAKPIAVHTKERVTNLESSVEQHRLEILVLKDRITALEDSQKIRRTDVSPSNPSLELSNKYIFERKILITLASCFTPGLFQGLFNLPPVLNIAIGLCTYATIDHLTEPLNERFEVFMDAVRAQLPLLVRQGVTHLHAFSSALLTFLTSAIRYTIALGNEIVRLSSNLYMLLINGQLTGSIVIGVFVDYISHKLFATTHLLNKAIEVLKVYQIDVMVKDIAENSYAQLSAFILMLLLGIGITNTMINKLIGYWSSSKTTSTSS